MSVRVLHVLRVLSTIASIVSIVCAGNIGSLDTNKKDIQVNVDGTDSFRLSISLYHRNSSEGSSVNVSVGCEPFHCSTFVRKPSVTSIELWPNNGKNKSFFEFNITGVKAGHDVIVAKVTTNNTKIDDDEAFVRIRVGRSAVWSVMAQVVGWIYFFVWSASFWPQNISNFRRKSVVGFNLDFAALNVTGFLFYTFFNCGLFLSSEVQRQYEWKFPRSEIPIELNDVIYSLHAAVATGITLVQCYVYERGDQRMSLLGKVFTGVTWTAAAIQLVLCLTNVMSWLTFLYYFSYVKLVVTSVKYVPQAWFNYKRKSTRGWSIAMIYMDFTGGVNGLLQMIFIAYNFDDWKTIFGNFAKFGLSVASISYDILFLLQEYVFYPKSDSSLQPLNEEKDYARKESRKSVISIVSIKSDSFSTSGPPEDKRRSLISQLSVISAKSAENVKNVFNY